MDMWNKGQLTVEFSEHLALVNIPYKAIAALIAIYVLLI